MADKRHATPTMSKQDKERWHIKQANARRFSYTKHVLRSVKQSHPPFLPTSWPLLIKTMSNVSVSSWREHFDAKKTKNQSQLLRGMPNSVSASL